MVKCTECRTIEMEVMDEKLWAVKCPKCGHTAMVVPMTKRQLRKTAKLAYLDGRHLNRGGGLNL